MTAQEALRDLRGKAIAYPTRDSEEAFKMALAALEKQSADGCEGCKYMEKDEFEMPCLICKRNKMDYWRAEE